MIASNKIYNVEMMINEFFEQYIYDEIGIAFVPFNQFWHLIVHMQENSDSHVKNPIYNTVNQETFIVCTGGISCEVIVHSWKVLSTTTIFALVISL